MSYILNKNTPADSIPLPPTDKVAWFMEDNRMKTKDSNGVVITYESSIDNGTVTQIDTGDGLVGGPITTTGTISLSPPALTALVNANTAIQPGNNVSLLTNDAGYTSNVGTVTSVAVVGNTGEIDITGSPITTDGTINASLADTTVTPGSYTNSNITVDSKGRITSASNGTGGGGGSGTVTNVSASGTQGVTASVTNSTTTPAITIGLGNITPTTVAATGVVTGSNLAGTNTGNQTITVSGDATGVSSGSPATTLPLTLANTTVTPGSYTNSNITIDSKGRITSASNGTVTSGTVTSVGITGSQGVTSSGSPITSSGSINIGLGDITPTSVTSGGAVTGSNLSGTNTGDQTIILSGAVTGSGTGSITTTYNENLPTNKLNSGTGATNTTFWRGDGTWATPPGAVTSVGISSSDSSLLITGSPITSNGVIDIKVDETQISIPLNQLSDVDVTGAAVGDTISFDGANWISKQKVNKIIAGTGISLSPGAGTGDVVINNAYPPVIQAPYIWSDLTTGNPAVGRIRANNAGSVDTITQLIVNKTDNDGTTRTFTNIIPGDTLFLAFNGTVTGRYNVSGAIVDGGTFVTIPVSFVSGAGNPADGAPLTLVALASAEQSNGTVTSVGSGTGLTGGPITNAGTLAIDPTYFNTNYVRKIGDTMSGDLVFDYQKGIRVKDRSNVTSVGQIRGAPTLDGLADLLLISGTDGASQNPIRVDTNDLRLNAPLMRVAVPNATQGARLVATEVSASTGFTTLGWEQAPIPGYTVSSSSTSDVFIGNGPSLGAWVKLTTDNTVTQTLNPGTDYTVSAWITNTNAAAGVIDLGVGFDGAAPTFVVSSQNISGSFNNGVAYSNITSNTIPNGTTFALWARIKSGVNGNFNATAKGTIQASRVTLKVTGTTAVSSINIAGSQGVTSAGGPITSSGTITVGLGDITPTTVSTGNTSIAGDLNLTGPGRFIQADFSSSSATKSKIRTNVLNGSTTVPLVPSGTATDAGFHVFNQSFDFVNCSRGVYAMSATNINIGSFPLGTGNQIPVNINSGSGNNQVRLETTGSVGLGKSSLATTATDGFPYISSMAGPPTGVPTDIVGKIPITVDSTNNALYFYTNGAWRTPGGGVSSFNSRVGAVTLNSTDVTTALGYTPATTLAQLTDVNLTTPVNDNTLSYQSGVWKNQPGWKYTDSTPIQSQTFGHLQLDSYDNGAGDYAAQINVIPYPTTGGADGGLYIKSKAVTFEMAGAASNIIFNVNSSTPYISTPVLTNLMAPTSAGDATNKSYVDGAVGRAILTDLLDVDIISPTNNQVLTYNSSSGLWVNQNPSSGGGSPGGNNTEIQFNDNGVFGASSNLKWDGSVLSVVGDAYVTNNIAVVGDAAIGNINIVGTGGGPGRIRGNFRANESLASIRTVFQDNGSNSSTFVGVIPTSGGLPQAASFYCETDPAQTNSSVFSFKADGFNGIHTIESFTRGTGTLLPILVMMGTSIVAEFNQNTDVKLGTTNLTTSSTAGFPFISSIAGTPTGTPTTYTGQNPIVIDGTNNRLYFYTNGAWRTPGGTTVNNASSAATLTPSADNDVFVVNALATNTTFAVPTGTPTDGKKLVIRLKDNNAGPYTLTWASTTGGYRASIDLPLPTSTLLNKTFYATFLYNSSVSRWDLVGLLNNF